MSFLDILYTVFIMPLQLAFEVLYTMTNTVIENPGLSIVALSLMMNFLVLPLYMRADAMQEHERDMENLLRRGVAHIKKTFRGNEKSMMLSTYYRQNGYRPTDVFKGSISLFLEIPFFISAYMFLSHLQILKGVQFWFIPDLGAPDGLLQVAGLSINVLPFVMTGINLVSCVLFTKGMPAKTKVQLYGMAVFFLVFLYASPAGLVFYWTLNNVFALVKTIFYKLKDPKRVLVALFAIAGAAFVAFAQVALPASHPTASVVVTVFGVGCMAPLAISLVRRNARRDPRPSSLVPSTKSFVAGTIFLTVFIGLFIPSSVIASSAAEFVDVTAYSNPVWFVVSSLCLSAGMFLVWFGVFYWLCKPRAKAIFEIGVWAFAIMAVVDYMFFGTNLGVLNSTLQYENEMTFAMSEQIVNLVCVVGIVVAVALLARYSKPRKLVPRVLAIAVVALVGMGAYNIVQINSQTADLAVRAEEIADQQPQFSLSKTGKNVVVIMLDRAMGEYVPYIMNEKPELKETFSGFTYYSNVVSFGAFTNVGTPAVFGGYEYTPEEMNARSDELLVDKQNEALKVMPVLFDENEYDVTVCDPVYANYEWVPDTSIYDDYPDIDAYVTSGAFNDESSVNDLETNDRNFFCFGVTKSMPLILQKIFYANGSYNSSPSASNTVWQTVDEGDYCKATGKSSSFMSGYNVLCNLDTMTNVDDGSTNTFMMLYNDTTHNPMMLQEPEYEPADYVDNTQYESENADRFVVDGQKLIVDNEKQLSHYQANMASLLKIGEWIEYLKANDVYDNTRIILVSDHGCNTGQIQSMIADPDSQQQDANTDTRLLDYEYYYPLLMMKDFGATEFTTDETFMTNADVPTLATQGLVENATNPFTGNAISNDEKTAHRQHIFGSFKWDTKENNGTTFLPDGMWFSVSDDMRDKDNWTQINAPAQ